jgi:hypothetical protein
LTTIYLTCRVDLKESYVPFHVGGTHTHLSDLPQIAFSQNIRGEAEYWWHFEAFRFLKSRSRAISLIDYTAEKEFVDKVPHCY